MTEARAGDGHTCKGGCNVCGAFIRGPAPVIEPSQGAEEAAWLHEAACCWSKYLESISVNMRTEREEKWLATGYRLGATNAGLAAAKAEQAAPSELGHVATVRRIAALVHEDGRPELAGRILVSEGTFGLKLNTPEFDEPLSPTTEELVELVASGLRHRCAAPESDEMRALAELARRCAK